MFASVFPRLPARLRHALAYIKAFAFLEDPARPVLASVLGVETPAPSAACSGDRRRGPGVARAARPGGVEHCATARSSAGRSGRPAAPPQRCATPTTSGRRAGRLGPAGASDRRVSVPGGFLHR